MRRGSEILWMLDYFREIESDFSVFYRIHDVSTLPGWFFFGRASLLFSYNGALRCRVESEMLERRAKEEAWKSRFSGNRSRSSAPVGSVQAKVVNGRHDASPELKSFVDFA